LVAHIQVLDCFADFLNGAHPGNLVQTLLDMKPKQQARLSAKLEGRRKITKGKKR
jgi:hypothetical protein